ncbi:hypothetical protein EMCRGX_G019526 [Ephydatia muelleri]
MILSDLEPPQPNQLTSAQESSICVVHLDHIRSETKYFKTLKSWSRELSIRVRVISAGIHFIYVILAGCSDNLHELLRRWRTSLIDVDTSGRPCKERLMSILCHLRMDDNQLSDRFNRKSITNLRQSLCSIVGVSGIELVHCGLKDIASHFIKDGLTDMFEQRSMSDKRKRLDADRDLWTVALEERDRNTEDREKSQALQGVVDGDTTLFFVGSQNAGKTTLILQFLEREEPSKPTTGLDYTYGRKSKGAKMEKDVTHMWELGGGTSLSKLIEIPITAASIDNLSVILVLDLSKPEELWITLEVALKQVTQCVNQVVSELKSSHPQLAQKLKQRRWKKFGEDHPDKDLLDPLPVPLLIVGTKYDIFQDFDSEKKKMVCKTLRFVSHINGASLQFYSSKSDALVNKVRQLLSHLAHGAAASHTMSMDYTKPLTVPAGSDALGQIGVPSLSSGELGKINARVPLELWKQAYGGFFPQVSVKSDKFEDPCKDPKYVEPAVDSMRAQKEEDLERYRKEREKKARDLARQQGQMVSSKT